MEITRPNGHTRVVSQTDAYSGACENQLVDAASRNAAQQASSKQPELVKTTSAPSNRDAEIDELVAACDVEEAITFLKWLDADGWHNLVAIHPDKNAPNRVVGRTFPPGSWAEMKKFIETHNGRRNLYYSVNEPKPNARHNNLNKNEIAFVRAIHVDIDPNENSAGEFESKRAHVESVVAELSSDPARAPSAVIDSGGGYQCFWKLSEKLAAGSPGDESHGDWAEKQAEAIGDSVGGDSTHDRNRIMRLPGTVNLPDDRKRAKGRKPAIARLVSFNARTYSQADLRTIAEPTPSSKSSKSNTAKKKKEQDAQIAAVQKQLDMTAIESVAETDDLPAGLWARFEAAQAKYRRLAALWKGDKSALRGPDDSGSGYRLALAHYLRGAGFAPQEYGLLLQTWNHAFQGNTHAKRRQIARDWVNGCPRGLNEGFEADPTVPESSYEWGEPANFWLESSEPPNLPPGIVPDLIERFTRDHGRRLGVEPGALAAPMIAAMGSLVHASNEIQARQKDTQWTERAILWAMSIGASGSKKTPMLSAVMAPVERIEKDWAKKFQREKAAVLARQELAGKKSQKAVPEPKRQRKIVHDVTTEKLAEILSENSGGLLLYADELSSLIGGMDAYRAKGERDQSFWLKAKDGKHYTIDRKTSGSTEVERLAVSIVGGIQPDKIASSAKKLTADGFLQRFWPVWISEVGKPVDDYPDTALNEAVLRLAQDMVEGPRNRRYRFTPEGNAELLEIESFRDREISRLHDSNPLRDFINKMPGGFARTALVFHIIEWYSNDLWSLEDDEPPEFISAVTARRARLFLTEFIFPHAAVFYRRLVECGEVESNAQWIAGFILSRNIETIDDRDIDRACPRLKRREKRRARLDAMHELEADGWLRVVKLGRDNQPSKWAVNPKVHDGRFEAIAQQERMHRSAVRKQIDADADKRRAEKASAVVGNTNPPRSF